MSYPFRMATAVLASLVMLADTAASVQSADNGPLQLEAKIPLGDMRGRDRSHGGRFEAAAVIRRRAWQ